MKKMRKGFTLVELLIVIGIMGILGAMGMIAGQEATSAARATVIADNLEKLATAAMMFYEENSSEIDKTGQVGGKNVTDEILVDGINAYLKDANKISTYAAAKDNEYFAAVNGTGAAMTWWVGYAFGTSDGNAQIQKAMVNKVNRMGLKLAAAGADYAGGNEVYMKIR